MKADLKITLTEEQNEALDKAFKWYELANKTRRKFEKLTPVSPQDIVDIRIQASNTFRLFGYAGTGKTTLINKFYRRIQKDGYIVAFVSYTGKAAMVLRQHGLPAQTIHSLLYTPKGIDRAKYKEFHKKFKTATTDKERAKWSRELRKILRPSFRKKDPEDFDNLDLIIIDECSMVDNEILADLESTEVPLLAVGDNGQLPPITQIQKTKVGGKVITIPRLISGRPDILLKEIHRQAKDNPIIEAATRTRNGLPLPFTYSGRVQRQPMHMMNVGKLNDYDQVLTGKNLTRRQYNLILREKQLKPNSRYPLEKDKLICLQNDIIPLPQEDEDGEPEQLRVYNGMFATVTKVKSIGTTTISLEVVFPDYHETPIDIEILTHYFDMYEDEKLMRMSSPMIEHNLRQNFLHFDFGYVITVHKSQGSQWDSVALIDDRFLTWDRKARRKWLYTAITRASEELLIVA